MGVKPAELFLSSASVEEFREKLIEANGDFDLEPDDMIELGAEYFKRYPDSFSERNMEEVHKGYRLARACIAEKLLTGIEESTRNDLRLMLEDITKIDEVVGRIGRDGGSGALDGVYGAMSSSLETVKKGIDGIPRGMIKERFVGGVTKFYNVMYLFKSGIERMKSSGA